MPWERRKVLVTVKAYPERSKKHGDVVCIAGITEEGEFIRLYPVLMEYFRGRKSFPKYTWIEVQCSKAKEKLNRKESYRIRDGTGIKVIDRSLTYETASKTPWEERKRIILPLVSPSLEELEERYKVDKTSLGVIKVHEIIDFDTKVPLGELEREEHPFVQVTLFGEKRSKLEKIPHIFHYRFKCCKDCRGHDMTIEDWELFQLYRTCMDKYETPEEAWEKIRQRYLDEFRKKDLYFYVGMYSQFPTWMIIGAFYPPKVEPSPQTTLMDDFSG